MSGFGNQAGGDMFPARIIAAGSEVGADGAGTGYTPHSWQELRLSGSGRAYVDNEQGRSGTTSIQPAFALDGSALTAGDKVMMRLRGNSSADDGPIYDVVSSIASSVPMLGSHQYIPAGFDVASGVSTPLMFSNGYWDNGGYINGTSGFLVPHTESGIYQIDLALAFYDPVFIGAILTTDTKIIVSLVGSDAQGTKIVTHYNPAAAGLYPTVDLRHVVALGPPLSGGSPPYAETPYYFSVSVSVTRADGFDTRVGKGLFPGYRGDFTIFRMGDL